MIQKTCMELDETPADNKYMNKSYDFEMNFCKVTAASKAEPTTDLARQARRTIIVTCPEPNQM